MWPWLFFEPELIKIALMADFAAVVELDPLVSLEARCVLKHVVGRDKREPDALFALAGAGEEVFREHPVDVFGFLGRHEPSAVRWVRNDELPFHSGICSQ